MDKLEKLNKLLELMQNETMTPKEVEKFLTVVLQTIKKSKEDFQAISKENLNTIQQAVNYIDSEHSKVLKDVSQETFKATERFEKKLAELKDLIAKVKTIKPIDGIDGKDGKDGEPGLPGKDGSPDTRKEIINKINEGGKEKIKVEQIEGTDKFTTQEKLDRAIGILDQRSQFLINKPKQIYVGVTQPDSPQVNDLWYDIS